MPEKNLIIRIRTKKGMLRLQTLTGVSTFEDLKIAIADETHIDIDCLKIMQGYPPVILANPDELITLSALAFKDGELLTVEESANKLSHTSHALASSSNKLNTYNKMEFSPEVLQSSSNYFVFILILFLCSSNNTV